jgi:hypothetical protein
MWTTEPPSQASTRAPGVSPWALLACLVRMMMMMMWAMMMMILPMILLSALLMAIVIIDGDNVLQPSQAAGALAWSSR